MDDKDGTKQQAVEQHTPGPWKTVDLRGAGYVVYDYGITGGENPGDLEVAQVATEADARLIEAAPELLEAAQFALRSLERDGKYVLGTEGMLRSAIQKATGVTA